MTVFVQPSLYPPFQDGGELILDTYTEVFGANDESYEKTQLAKIQ
jgi:hypothetical protein